MVFEGIQFHRVDGLHLMPAHSDTLKLVEHHRASIASSDVAVEHGAESVVADRVQLAVIDGDAFLVIEAADKKDIVAVIAAVQHTASEREWILHVATCSGRVRRLVDGQWRVHIDGRRRYNVVNLQSVHEDDQDIPHSIISTDDQAQSRRQFAAKMARQVSNDGTENVVHYIVTAMLSLSSPEVHGSGDIMSTELKCPLDVWSFGQLTVWQWDRSVV